MTAKVLSLLLLLSLFTGFGSLQAQDYPTQPISAQNAAALVPLIALDHTTLLDTEYPFSPTPTAYYSYSLRSDTDPDLFFSPDGRYLAHIISRPLTLWLVDLAAGTERAFLVYGVDLVISPDWRTLAVIEQSRDSYELHTRLWDMDTLLAIPGAPIGMTTAGVCQFRVTISSTNLRTTPSIKAASAGYALAGQTYPVVAVPLTDEWIELHGERQPVWIGRPYGTLDGACDAVPVMLLPGADRALLVGGTIHFSPDGQYLLVGGRTGEYSRFSPNDVQVYRSASGQLVSEFKADGYFTLSPDSRLLVDQAGQFFEIASGKRLYSMVGDVSPYSEPTSYYTIFSPDSGKVALSGNDGIVRLLDSTSGQELRTFTMPEAQLHHLEFSPDAHYLLVDVYDYEGRSRNMLQSLHHTFLWDLAAPQTQVLVTHDTEAYIPLPDSVDNGWRDSFLPDGSAILRQTYDPSTVGIWDIAKRAFRWAAALHNGFQEFGELAPDGASLLLTQQKGYDSPTQTFVSLQTGEALGTLAVRGSNFSSDARWLVIEDLHGIVRLWGVPANVSIPTLPPTATPTPTATQTAPPPGFTPTATLTAGVSFEDMVRSTMTAQAAVLALTPSLTPTPSYTPQIMSTSVPIPTLRPGVQAINAGNLQQVTLLNTIKLPPNSYYSDRDAQFTPDGSRLVTGGGTSIDVWDVFSGERLLTMDAKPAVLLNFDVSRDGQYVLAVTTDKVMRLWSLVTGALLKAIPLENVTGWNMVLRISPDNRLALVLEGSQSLRIRSLETGEIVTDSLCCGTSGGFRPDGAAVWWDTDSVYSTATMRTTPYLSYLMYDLPRGLLGETNVVASADLTRLATYDPDRVNIRLWDTAGGQEPLLLQGHTAPVQAVYFSGDSRLLVSFDQSGTLLVWDTSTGAMLPTVPEGALPRGMSVGSRGRLWRAKDGSPQIWNPTASIPKLVVGPGSDFSMSADAATLVTLNREIVMIFGLPSEARAAYGSVPARIVPKSINVRLQPSLEAAATGTISGVVIVAGRDETGQFVYLPQREGWIRADPAYLDLGGLLVDDLPIRQGE